MVWINNDEMVWKCEFIGNGVEQELNCLAPFYSQRFLKLETGSKSHQTHPLDTHSFSMDSPNLEDILIKDDDDLLFFGQVT